MPFRIRRWSTLGRPVQGFSGGSKGCKRRDCVSSNSLRLTPSVWDHAPETSGVCRHDLAQTIEAEAEAFLATTKSERLPDERERVVRHGHDPERQMQTEIGPVEIQRVKLRDRAADEAGVMHIRFSSATLLR